MMKSYNPSDGEDRKTANDLYLLCNLFVLILQFDIYFDTALYVYRV